MTGWRNAILGVALVLAAAPAQAAPDRSGRSFQGEASVLADRPAPPRPGDGRGYDPETAAAVSHRLPPGTTARVTNLENGRVAMIRVQRPARRAAPDGRAAEGQVRVSPRVARMLQLAEGRPAPVLVAPLAVPQADGTIRLGQGTGYDGQQAVIVHPERG